MAKALYQSDLVKQPHTLTITGDVRRGQYGPYVPVRLESGEERNLNLENESIVHIIGSYPQNTTLTLTGFGTREKATIQVVEHTPARQRVVAQQEAKPEREPVFQQMSACWEAAGRICPDDTAVRGTICNSMFIELNKSGGTRALYGLEGARKPEPMSEAPRGDSLLDKDAGFKNLSGQTWRQIADSRPESVEWAIKNLRRLTDAERAELQGYLDSIAQGAGVEANPFLQDELPL